MWASSMTEDIANRFNVYVLLLKHLLFNNFRYSINRMFG